MNEQLAFIQAHATLYAILFRNAGVALQFYEGPGDRETIPDDWRNYLKVDQYYPTLTEAVQAEYDRLMEKARA